MRILYLTQWYLPEPMRYQSDLAETLRDQGHEVTVLTGYPNWPVGKLAPGYRMKSWQRDNINGIPIIRVPLYPDHSTSAFHRALNFSSLALSTMLLGPCLVPTFDLIHCNFPPVSLGPPAWLLSHWMRVPLSFEVLDLWPETLEATGMVRNRWVLGLVDHVAQWGYRQASAIRVVTPGFREHLIAKGVAEEKIRVISNWVDVERYRPEEVDENLASDLGLAGRFNVVFAGTIGLAQGLDTVLEAAPLLANVPEVQFVLVGDGADLARLKSLAVARSLPNIRFIGRVPPEQMGKLYAIADVLLVTLRDSPLFRITIPHKIFAYMASEKPVLAAIEGDSADVILRAKAGLQCPPNDPQALSNTVRRFLAMSAAERKAMGRNGRRVTIESYGRQMLVSQVADMFSEARARTKSRRG